MVNDVEYILEMSVNARYSSIMASIIKKLPEHSRKGGNKIFSVC